MEIFSFFFSEKNIYLTVMTLVIVLFQIIVGLQTYIKYKWELKKIVTSLDKKRTSFLSDLKSKIKDSNTNIISPLIQFNSTSVSKSISNLFNTIESRSNFLIQMGLLGTFLGISFLIINLAGANESKNIDLVPMISSSGIAFFSSLFGLIASMSLRYGFPKLANIFDNFKQDIIFDLNFHYAMLASHSMAKNNTDLADKLSQNFSDSISNLALKVDNYSTKIQLNTDNVTKNIASLIVDINQTVENSFKTLDKSVLAKLEKRILDFDTVVEKYRNNAVDISVKVNEQINFIEQEFARVGQSLINYKTTVNEFTQSIKDSNIAASENTTATKVLSESLVNATEKQNDIFEKTHSFSSALSENANTYNEATKNLIENYHQANIKINNIFDSFGKLIPSINESINELNSLPDKLNNLFTDETRTELRKQ